MYDENSIQVLEGLDAVRKRPGMFIGDTAEKGLHHILWEVVDNAVDEVLAGYANKITVELDTVANCIQVVDNGRGIPLGTHSSGENSMTLVLSKLHAGGKFENSAYKTASGLHGVGVSVTNALSSRFEAIVRRDKKIATQIYQKGKLQSFKTKEYGGSVSSTRIIFVPDEEIFGPLKFNEELITSRLNQLAYILNVEIVFTIDGKEIFKKRNPSLESFVKEISVGKQPIFDEVIEFEGEHNGIKVCAAFGHYDTEGCTVKSFVNTITTRDGGSHVVGFLHGLKSSCYHLLSNNISDLSVFNSEDFTEGLVAVVSVFMNNPMFESQTKVKLFSKEAVDSVSNITMQCLRKAFTDKKIMVPIIRYFKAVKDERIAIKKAKEKIRKERNIVISELPIKLSDCSIEGEEAELFIVEGDSAGGSTKMARDKEFQAVLPIKGKILNVLKSNKVSNEIKNVAQAIGLKPGAANTSLDGLRYGKIILLTDADVDGYHIRTLLLTLFYTKFRSVIEDGRIYIAKPPLYRVKTKDGSIVYTDEILDGSDIIRFKGIGEMNPGELWDTTLDPSKRNLERVGIDDAIEVFFTLNNLLGDNVQKRKEILKDVSVNDS